MLRLFLLTSVFLAILNPCFSQSKQTPKASPKTAPKSQAKAKSPAKPPVRWQAQPSQQRYREIQQALSDKGYFRGTVDGNWGPDSLDALKRFQSDQNFVADGKLSSLTLIALGLGSEHGSIPPIVGPDGVHP